MSYNNFQVVVVDNNSPNDSEKYLKEWAEGKLVIPAKVDKTKKGAANFSFKPPIPYTYFHNSIIEEKDTIQLGNRLTIIQAGSNGGFAKGNNIFLKKVLNEDAYVWLLNPDTVVEANALEELVLHATKTNLNTVIGTVIKDFTNPQKIMYYGGCRIKLLQGAFIEFNQDPEANDLDYITGASLFTHLSNFQKVGLLPEEYFLYWEETDWCHNAKANNIKFEICQNAIIYEKISTSVGRGFLGDYYVSANRLKFLKKYFPKYIPLCLIFNFIRIFKRLAEGRIQNALGVWRGSMSFILNKPLKNKN